MGIKTLKIVTDIQQRDKTPKYTQKIKGQKKFYDKMYNQKAQLDREHLKKAGEIKPVQLRELQKGNFCRQTKTVTSVLAKSGRINSPKTSTRRSKR